MESRNSLRATFLVLLYAISCKIISGFFYLTICGNFRSLLLDILFFQYSNLLLLFPGTQFSYKFRLCKTTNIWKYVCKYIFGMLVGTIVLSIGLLLITTVSKVSISYSFTPNSTVYLLVIVGFVVQSYAEEFLFRGRILAILSKNFNWYISSGIQAFTFTFVHSLNGGFTIISFFTLFFFGILMSLFSVFTKSLSFSSGFHFIWNSIPCIALGMNVSGVKVPFSLLSTNLTGQDLYTGGVFGIEGSILVLCVVFILTVALLQRACREKLGHKGN